MWKVIVVAAALTPVAAIFLGAGVLAYNVSHTWDSRNTDALISGLISSCLTGSIVLAILLAVIIGVPFAIRLMSHWQETGRGQFRPRMIDAHRAQWHESDPPQLVDKNIGSWQTQGQATYDLWLDHSQLPQQEQQNY